MLFTTAFCCFLLFWSGLWLIDFYLRSGNCQAYVDFAEKSGLLVAPFQIRFYTRSFQQSSLLQSLAAKSPTRSPRLQRFASFWFGIGALACVFCFIGITGYLTHLFLADLGSVTGGIWKEPSVDPFTSSYRVRRSVMPAAALDHPSPERHHRIPSVHHRVSQQGLTPIIPGVNIPWTHMPIFLGVLVVAGVVHELGHAMAAVGANVAVNGFGVFFYAVYPGAFTEIDTDGLNRSSSIQKLRIYGAGIWHNLVFALLGYLLLAATPTLLFPLFTTGNGVTVTGVNSLSGLTGPSGLRRGHVVEAINGCPVKTVDEWKKCVEAANEHSRGYAIPDHIVQRYTASKIESTIGEMQCCAEFVNSTASPHICFQFVNHNATAEVNEVPEIRVPRQCHLHLDWPNLSA
ncbi:hypothetical protein L596_024249 [Steinernema carpocapsae]|uniref:Membrane-bound transcription factor site-2 protease n=1 Tax=Steinernema carpocapsae TaxID=34508 RepID=A0A4U5MGG0_STECR|nr:hypothetical protein L596_024249 [Steinernema carpocapsae]